jgi:hypothetical protein
LLVVDPRVMPEPNAAPPIVATALRVGQARAGATALSSLTLSASERSFTLDFAAADFVAPQRLTYRHRLERLDDQWTVAGPSQHSLTMSRMPPKEFLVVVRFIDRADRLRLLAHPRRRVVGARHRPRRRRALRRETRRTECLRGGGDAGGVSGHAPEGRDFRLSRHS